MGLSRRQTEDPRILRETLDGVIDDVDALTALDETAIGAVKDVAAIKADVTAVAAIDDDVATVADIDTEVAAVAAMPIQGVPKITAAAESAGVIAVTVQAQTIAAADLEARRILTVWVGATEGGAPSEAMASVAVTTGAVLTEEDGIIEIVSDASGKAVITVTAKDNGDVYVMASDNGVKAQKLTFAAVP